MDKTTIIEDDEEEFHEGDEDTDTEECRLIVQYFCLVYI